VPSCGARTWLAGTGSAYLVRRLDLDVGLCADCGGVVMDASAGESRYRAWLTDDMLKSGTRQAGVAVRVK
jgi:hypothetical protein